MAQFPAKDVTSWLGNSEPVAMRHYAMATDEAFIAASRADAQTVSRKVDTTEQSANVPDGSESDTDGEVADIAGDARRGGGSIGGSISTQSGDIRRTAEATAGAVFTNESGGFIVEDSAGGYWLVGVEGLEPPTPSV